MHAPVSGFAGSTNLMVPVKLGSDRPVAMITTTANFNAKLAVNQLLSSVLRQISSNGRRPLPPECHGLVDQIS